MDLIKGVFIFVFAGFVLFSVSVVVDRAMDNYVIDNVPSVSAKCKDGSFSTSKRDNGTCSHHGGVAKWVIR